MGAWLPTPAQAPEWDPTLETEAQYLERHRAYIELTKTLPGIEPTPVKDADSHHWEWLARHHAGRWTYDQLAEHYQDAEGRPEVPAISRAVTTTAALIGLTLRAGRGRKLSRAET